MIGVSNELTKLRVQKKYGKLDVYISPFAKITFS